ncbi:MAG: copper resistance CopC family protein [Gemmatimonadota bacterium]
MQRLTRLMLVPAAVLATMAFTFEAPEATGLDALHFALSSSAPQAGYEGASPAEIRLTFTEEPADETVSIRVLEVEGAGVHVMDAAQDDHDPTTFAVMVHGTFPAGTYTVSWRGMGADGHVVRDTFQFTVRGD